MSHACWGYGTSQIRFRELNQHIAQIKIGATEKNKIQKIKILKGED